MQAFFKDGLFLTTYVFLNVKIVTDSSVQIKTSKKNKKKPQKSETQRTIQTHWPKCVCKIRKKMSRLTLTN